MLNGGAAVVRLIWTRRGNGSGSQSVTEITQGAGRGLVCRTMPCGGDLFAFFRGCVLLLVLDDVERQDFDGFGFGKLFN